jgi:hypothetical protein
MADLRAVVVTVHAVHPCADSKHDRCNGCACPCHDEQRETKVLIDYTAGRVEPLHVRDLLAHLRSGPEHLGALTVQQAARVVRYVVDLGWWPS